MLNPVQSGEGDREFYQQVFFPALSLEAINPQYFAAPWLLPWLPTWNGRSIDLAMIWQTLETMTQNHDWVLVRGCRRVGVSRHPRHDGG